MQDLNSTVKDINEKGEVPSREVSLITFADLNSPRVWQNQNGEMDAINLFFGNLGMANRDHVLDVIQGRVNQQLREGVPERRGGEVIFESGIPGVRTKVKYAYWENGEIAYIQPEILIDSKVEITV